MIIKDYTVARLEESDILLEFISGSVKYKMRKCVGKLLNGDNIIFWKEEKC